MTRFCFLFLLLGFSLAQGVAAPLKIGILLKDRNLFWAQAEKGAIAAAQAGGVELIIKAPSVPNSLTQQLTLLAALSTESLDALIVAPLSAPEFREPLAGFRAKGVKIVALDTNAPDDLAAVYIGYNQTTMAEAAARFIGQIAPADAPIAMMRATSIEGMSVREKSLIATLRAIRGKSTIYHDIISGSERNDDYEKLLVLLKRHPDAKLVCTPFSDSSMAMIKVIREKHLEGKVLHVGFGSGLPAEVFQALEDGAMQGWIAQQPKLIGSLGVEAAIALAAGKNVPGSPDVPYFIVTQADLTKPEIVALRN